MCDVVNLWAVVGALVFTLNIVALLDLAENKFSDDVVDVIGVLCFVFGVWLFRQCLLY